jgi:SAM-dependent methyltransferase
MSCPLCGGSSRHAFGTTDRNRGLSAERFAYERCTACGVLFLANVPADLGAYYPEAYYVLPDRGQLLEFARLEAYKIELLRRHLGSGRVVEIGPGFGVFAHQAKDAGFDYTGIEMDERSCEYLRSEVGVEAIRSDAPHTALGELEPSDAIAAWHALEHLPEPWQCLDAAARNLAPGGVLLVAMPNPNAFQFRVLRGRWPHIDAPRHLFLIPAESLEARAKEAGLEPVSVTSDDAGARQWNVFGWQRALLRPSSGAVATRLALGAARATAALLSPLEHRDLAGSTYTAVFRKP